MIPFNNPCRILNFSVGGGGGGGYSFGGGHKVWVYLGT